MISKLYKGFPSHTDYKDAARARHLCGNLNYNIGICEQEDFFIPIAFEKNRSFQTD